jgi:hypothetical protein
MKNQRKDQPIFQEIPRRYEKALVKKIHPGATTALYFCVF